MSANQVLLIGIIAIVGVVLIIKIGIALTVLLMKKTNPDSEVLKRLTLESSDKNATGEEAEMRKSEYMGAMGSAFTDLRPAGIAMINDERVDVVTRGEYVKKDSPVRVIEVNGMKIVVEAIEGKW